MQKAKNLPFLKVQQLSKDIRVVMEPFGKGFAVHAQQYLPDCARYWEVGPDGWRDTVHVTAPTLEGARREFEAMVKREERYLEAR